MRKINYEEVTKLECVTKKVICNKCGKEIEIIHNYGRVPHNTFQDYCRVDTHWDHYKEHSQKHMDIESFDLCEDCYNELVTSFKIPLCKF